MRVEYINPFVEAAYSVLGSFIPHEVRHGAIGLSESISAKGFSATVFLTGKVEGRVVIDLDQRLARHIAGLLNGMTFEELNHLAIDTICEIANIIIGKAVTSLNNSGFNFKTSPPCFFIGEKTCHGLEAICIPLHTKWGEIRIQAAIREKDWGDYDSKKESICKI